MDMPRQCGGVSPPIIESTNNYNAEKWPMRLKSILATLVRRSKLGSRCEMEVFSACADTWTVGTLVAFGIVAMPSSSSAMDCGRATTSVEVAICANETLKSEDARLSQQYFAVLEKAKANGALYDDDSRHNLLIKSQREWLAQREEACGGMARDQIGGCIADFLRSRTSELSAAGRADEFEQTHRGELQEMMAASVRVETSFNTIFDEFTRKVRSDPDPRSPALRAEGSLNHDCYDFIQARFYAKYQSLLDNIDTYPFDSTSVFALRKSRSDTSPLHDPRKRAVEIRYIISSFKFLKDFHPPLEEFVVRYAARPDLEAKCTHYLDVTGMRD